MAREVIWRYRTRLAETMPLPVPPGAEILTVAKARGSDHDIELWARVDPDAPTGERVLRAVGTGCAIEPATVGRFLGTVLFHDGEFVFHLFETADPTGADLTAASTTAGRPS